MVRAGNPKQIQGIHDLGRADIRYVNRNHGSGTRIWLDQQLRSEGLQGRKIQGYELEVNTHLEVAQAIFEGRADVGLGIYAAAKQYELDFIPLFEERYDLVITREHFQSPAIAPTLDYIQSADFRQAVHALGGYNCTKTGQEIDLQ
jgi:putative molybdopterin biosynthesis protein